MNKIAKIWAGTGYGLLAPALVLAQSDFTNVESGFSSLARIINSYLIPLLIGVGLLLFLWGIIGYFRSSADEAKRKESRNMMIWGIVTLFVMVSVWGLVNVLVETFGLTNTPPAVPVTPPTGQ